MKRFILLLIFTIVLCMANAVNAVDITLFDTVVNPSIEGFEDGIHHWNLLHKERNYQRLEASDYRRIADNLLAYQNQDGGWMKNIDWLGVLNADSVVADLTERYRQSTLDNRNTFPQIEYLAEVYCLTSDKRYAEGCRQGLEYLLNTQKDNGGWRGWDVDAITFNDDVSTGAIQLFQRITYGDEKYDWLDNETKQRISKAYDKGLEMILKTQVIQNGRKTAWTQQHDNVTLLPVKGRSFELPGITARESCPVIMLLMDVRNPSKEIVDAVMSAVSWLRESAIKGVKVAEVSIPEKKQYNHEYPFDRVVVADSAAKPIWARFYETDDNTPFFCRRDGQKVSSLAEVDGERRTGYDWYGYWPEEVLKKYDEWIAKQRRNVARHNVPLDSIYLSDPFILADKATMTYYMTGTGGMMWKSKDLQLWDGPYHVAQTDTASWMGHRPMIWAAELHQYDGKYYYFATFTNRNVMIDTVRGNAIERRACHVLVSDRAEGPYRPMKDKTYLPANQPTLDATFWLEDGKPYMIFCHEWLQNWNGTVERIELKPDLSGTIDGTRKLLFRAFDSPWSRERHDDGSITPNKVTDGPFLFRTQTGRLGMIWTSWRFGDYTQGVAYSESGRLDGPWIQQKEPITPPNYGHGMIFTTFDGRRLLCCHSHNKINGRTVRKPVFFNVDDSGDEILILIQ